MEIKFETTIKFDPLKLADNVRDSMLIEGLDYGCRYLRGHITETERITYVDLDYDEAERTVGLEELTVTLSELAKTWPRLFWSLVNQTGDADTDMELVCKLMNNVSARLR